MPVILMAIAALAVSGFIGVMRYIDKAPENYTGAPDEPKDADPKGGKKNNNDDRK